MPTSEGENKETKKQNEKATRQEKTPNHPMQLRKKVNHMYKEDGSKLHIDMLLKQNPTIWKTSITNELGRLAKGIKEVKGNDVIEFIMKKQIPPNKKVTYANMVCDYRPLKSDPWRTRLTIGGDMLDYYGDATSPASTLLDTKLLINSVISDSKKGAIFLTLDLKDHFLQSLMKDSEYMRIHGKYFYGDMMIKYDIDSIVHSDGYVYCKIKRGIYGLKQSARLEHNMITQHLKKYGYKPDKYAVNIWSHITKPKEFCLCVDDFVVKYYSKTDAHHLIDSLKEAYDITVDWSGENYCGLKLDWDYKNEHVDISMPNYVIKALHRLQHKFSTSSQHAPHQWSVPNFNQKVQYTELPDNTQLLNKQGKTRIQQIVGTFCIMEELWTIQS